MDPANLQTRDRTSDASARLCAETDMAPRVKLERGEWSRVLQLLDQALDVPGSEREGWLDGLSDQDQRLRPALESLIEDRRSIEASDFLNQGPSLAEANAEDEFTAGQIIGPYRLTRRLGRGGMASVWLAERADGAHRRPVALKLPLVMHRPRVIADRFAREREILSNLSAPHIALVLDAGVDQGQPYLAVEYVDGESITSWCDRNDLSVPARLRLFLQVLRAVQHAHAQLVIHRDIKPSNVFVDRAGQVKLLDFGVAKLLDSGNTVPATELTRFGGRAMTLQYASPEQIAGTALGTASDIYSLGVLLYELMTGRLPYVTKRDTRAAMEDAIVSANITSPSAAVTDRTRPRALRGDIDTIVLKALRTSPAERYGSAEAFALDIERHLESKPIKARRTSMMYRLRKLLFRHRVAFVAGIAIALVLIVGIVATMWQAEHARAQAARAEAVQRFLQKALAVNDPQEARGQSLSAAELLDRSAARIESEFANQPDVQASLHHAVAGIYASMGQHGKALPHATRAVTLLEAQGQSGTERHLDALQTLNDLEAELLDYAAYAVTVQRALQLAEQKFGTPNRWQGRLLINLSWLASQQNDLVLAEELAQQAAAVQRAYSGTATPDYARNLNRLAQVRLERGAVREARAPLMQIKELAAALPEYEITDRLVNRYNLARVEYMLENYDAAAAELSALLPQMEKHIGPIHDRTMKARGLYAQTLAELGRHDDGLRLAQDNLAYARSRPVPIAEDVAFQASVLGKLLKSAALYDEGLEYAREGIAYFETSFQQQPIFVRERARWILGELLVGAGQTERGVASLRSAVTHSDKIADIAVHPGRAHMMLSLAVATGRDARDDEPLKLTEQACVILNAAPDANIAALRCAAIKGWIEALRLMKSDRGAALKRFSDARAPLLQKLRPDHPLRFELMALEAELMQAAQMPGTSALRRQAEIEFQRVVGQPLPEVVLVLH